VKLNSNALVNSDSVLSVLYNGCVLFQLAQVVLSNLRNAPIDLINLQKRTLQITLLFGHAHTTHNADKYINVYVNIDDVAVVVPWV